MSSKSTQSLQKRESDKKLTHISQEYESIPFEESSCEQAHEPTESDEEEHGGFVELRSFQGIGMSNVGGVPERRDIPEGVA